MPETIEVWDEPRLLRFKILRTPPSMRELSPWGAIHPPHLEGFYVSRRGQFRLVGGLGHVKRRSLTDRVGIRAAFQQELRDLVMVVPAGDD